MSEVTAKAISKHTLRYLHFRFSDSMAIPNVRVGRSPWECDVVKVTPAWFWVEYEIKVTLNDFHADFDKCLRRYKTDSAKKHDVYSANDHIPLGHGRAYAGKIVPKPKQFYFVVPRGMLDTVDVPDHCGIMEFDGSDHYWLSGVRVTRTAPCLPCATKLDAKEIFRLGRKASHRILKGVPT